MSVSYSSYCYWLLLSRLKYYTTKTRITATNLRMRKRLAAEVLTSRTKPGGRGPYKKDRGRIFPRHNQTDGVNKGFIIWYFWTAREKRDKG